MPALRLAAISCFVETEEKNIYGVENGHSRRPNSIGFSPSEDPRVYNPMWAKLTGVEILRRMHVVLGHPSLPVLLATLMASKDVSAHIITKADIEQYVRLQRRFNLDSYR